MDTLLRKLAEWKGRRRAAQVIVFDGGAEVEKTRALLKGAVGGMILATVVFLITAPSSSTDTEMLEELNKRQRLLDETSARLNQAMGVANVCLNTAQQLENTLKGYQKHLGGKLIR